MNDLRELGLIQGVLILKETVVTLKEKKNTTNTHKTFYQIAKDHSNI